MGCKGSVIGADNILSTQKKSFAKESLLSNLMDHFIENVKDENLLFEVSPPACPPTYECRAQFGYAYLNVSKTRYSDVYKILIEKKIKYKTRYSKENIIINFDEFKDNLFSVSKCNLFYKNKYPIPYFENYDFGLGHRVVDKKNTNGDDDFFKYIYTVPSDLIVYVIDAQAGVFWKKNCNEKRPNTLGVWKNGFSKGFALSEDKDMLVFWTIIW